MKRLLINTLFSLVLGGIVILFLWMLLEWWVKDR